MIIRRATDSDFPEVRSVVERSFEEYKSVLSENDWREFWSSVTAALNIADQAVVLVAEVSRVLVGTIFLFPSGVDPDPTMPEELYPPSPTIRLLSVLHSHRRTGVGVAPRLLAAALNEVRSAGESRVVAHIADDMPASKPLVLAYGFKPDHELDFQPAPDVWVRGYRLECGGWCAGLQSMLELALLRGWTGRSATR